MSAARYQVGQWKHGLCSCFDDCGLCILTYLVPCVTFGQTAEAVGEGSCLACGCAFMVPILHWIVGLQVRQKIREMQGIDGSALNDCLMVFCCPFCSLMQEAQEIHEAGMTMSRE